MEKNLFHCQSLFVDWGLKFRVLTASDPFFATGSERKRVYQMAMDLKYELQVYIPHSKSWLAVASFNNHQQSLVVPYNINFNSTSPLFSGCVGYGYERLAYALYSQFGTNEIFWPEDLKYDIFH